MTINTIYNENCITGMKSLADKSIHCCVTSPPYYGLRDYGTDEQIGLEETPEAYVQKIVEVFREIKRVLRDDGTLWLNLGDSYWGGKGQSGQAWSTEHTDRDTLNGKQHQISGARETRPTDRKHNSIKSKDLIGIPWMVAFALRADGWYLRSDIIWNKPNPMPESVTDRCTKSHEYIFLLSKSQRYYYDYEAIKTPIKDASVQRLMQDVENQQDSKRVPGKTNGNMKAVRPNGIVRDRLLDYNSKEKELRPNTKRGEFKNESELPVPDLMANKKSVWTVTTKPYSEAHFATYPEALIVDCIKAGCPEQGIVLDPFMGAGTTAIVARKLNRNYIGYELNPQYVKIAENRIYKTIGLFA